MANNILYARISLIKSSTEFKYYRIDRKDKVTKALLYRLENAEIASAKCRHKLDTLSEERQDLLIKPAFSFFMFTKLTDAEELKAVENKIVLTKQTMKICADKEIKTRREFMKAIRT